VALNRVAADGGGLRARATLVLIVNPGATRVDGSTVREVVRALRQSWELEVRCTEGPGHAVALARESARGGADVVAALGGDGTVNEVANGLAGSETAMCCLSGGRTNSFARTIGSPANPARAAEALNSRRRVGVVDVGIVGGRRFLGVSAIGPLATASGDLSRRRRLAGSAAAGYFAAATLATAAVEFLGGATELRISANGQSLQAVAGVVQNAAPATWIGRRPLHVCDTAGLGSGTLAAAFLGRGVLRDLPSLTARAVWGRRGAVLCHPHVQAVPSTACLQVRSSSGEPFAVEADGELLGRFEEVEYQMRPAALRVLTGGASEACF